MIIEQYGYDQVREVFQKILSQTVNYAYLDVPWAEKPQALSLEDYEKKLAAYSLEDNPYGIPEHQDIQPAEAKNSSLEKSSKWNKKILLACIFSLYLPVIPWVWGISLLSIIAINPFYDPIGHCLIVWSVFALLTFLWRYGAKESRPLIKQQLIRPALEKEFVVYEIADHAQKFVKTVDQVYRHIRLKNIIERLGIRNNHWFGLTLYDMMFLSYKNVPFVFMDLDLDRSFGLQHFRNRDKREGLQFMGQVMIFPCALLCDRRVKGVDINSLNSDVEGYPWLHIQCNCFSKQTKPDPLLSEIKQWICNANVPIENNEIFALMREDDECYAKSVDEEAWVSCYKGAFEELANVVGCKFGVVVAGAYMVLILENNFAPFEFSLKNSSKFNQLLPKKVAWIRSILDVLIQHNVVRANNLENNDTDGLILT